MVLVVLVMLVEGDELAVDIIDLSGLIGVEINHRIK